MCGFFSLTSDGKGNIKYFNWELRKKCISGELNYDPDSHTSINDYYGFNVVRADNRNKYEFNPLIRKFTVDQINGWDDSDEVERQVRELDFKGICPKLVIKPIVNPLTDIRFDGEVTEEHIGLLRKWSVARICIINSVRDSIIGSVDVSIWDSVWDSIWSSIWNPVRAAVWDSIWDPVRAIIRDSIWDSVGDSIWSSVDDFVYSYISSFFNLEKDEWKHCDFDFESNPFQVAIDLWNMGLIPSYDGNVWRLHAGRDAKVVWKGVVLL